MLRKQILVLIVLVIFYGQNNLYLRAQQDTLGCEAQINNNLENLDDSFQFITRSNNGRAILKFAPYDTNDYEILVNMPSSLGIIPLTYKDNIISFLEIGGSGSRALHVNNLSDSIHNNITVSDIWTVSVRENDQIAYSLENNQSKDVFLLDHLLHIETSSIDELQLPDFITSNIGVYGAISYSGDTVAYVQFNSTENNDGEYVVRIHNIITGEFLDITSASTDWQPSHINWVEYTSYLYISDMLNPNIVNIYDTQSGSVIYTIEPPRGLNANIYELTRPIWSPIGNYIAIPVYTPYETEFDRLVLIYELTNAGLLYRNCIDVGNPQTLFQSQSLLDPYYRWTDDGRYLWWKESNEENDQVVYSILLYDTQTNDIFQIAHDVHPNTLLFKN